MIIIHSVAILPRIVGTALSKRLKVMPAVVVTGARQTGKSTLAEHLVPDERRVPLPDRSPDRRLSKSPRPLGDTAE